MIGVCIFDTDNRLTGIDFHPVVIGGEQGLSHSRLEERLAPHLATRRERTASSHGFRYSLPRWERGSKSGTTLACYGSEP